MSVLSVSSVWTLFLLLSFRSFLLVRFFLLDDALLVAGEMGLSVPSFGYLKKKKKGAI